MEQRVRLIVILPCLALICMIFSFIVTGGSVWAKSISRWQGYTTNINCGLPTNNAMTVLPNGNLKVRIRHGDIGKCQTDPKPYKSNDWYKPYSERAELVIRKKLRKGRTHNIRFEAKFLSGFIEADRSEAYFQIKGCAKSKVPVSVNGHTIVDDVQFRGVDDCGRNRLRVGI